MTTIINGFDKDPDDNMDYGLDWSEWLEKSNDTIASSAWIVPSGITEGVKSVTDGITSVWLTGGTLGENYSLVNRITTAGGRIKDQTIVIMCRAA